MNNIYPLPATGTPLAVRIDSQELLCALYAHGIEITAITVAPHVQVSAVREALESIGARVVVRHNRYEVVK